MKAAPSLSVGGPPFPSPSSQPQPEEVSFHQGTWRRGETWPFPEASCLTPHSQPGASPACCSPGPLPPLPSQPLLSAGSPPPSLPIPTSAPGSLPPHFSPARSSPGVCLSTHPPPPSPPLPKLDSPPAPPPVSLLLPLWFALPHLSPYVSLPLSLSPCLPQFPISLPFLPLFFISLCPSSAP